MGSIAYKNWECSKCQQIFETRRDRNGHCCPNKKDYIWVCTYCDLQLSTRRSLDSHKKDCVKKPKVTHDWVCSFCNEQFKTRALLQEHRKFCDRAQKSRNSKGMIHGDHTIPETKCKFCDRTFTNSSGLSLHQKHCKDNPNRVKFKSHKLTEEQKKKLSESMKKAHAEGRAGSFPSRKGCEKSYPEKWFESVIKNRFEDQNYEIEYHLGKYFLDFAWPQKKRFIEIDGQ